MDRQAAQSAFSKGNFGSYNPRMKDRDQILGLEERALNGWPSTRATLMGGWVIRTADGFTKRANSATPLYPTGCFANLRPTIEEIYFRSALPPIFRVTPLADKRCDADLDAAGYRFFDPSLVMVVGVERAEISTLVKIAPRPDAEWLAGAAVANDVRPAERPLHDALVKRILPPVAFATLRDEGSPIGFAIGVVERGALGIFDLVVAPAARGTGKGRILAEALLAWGFAMKADRAYLQARLENHAAIALYRRLGFTEAYRYHYRMPPKSPE